MPSFTDRSDLLPQEAAALANELRKLKSLQEVVRWGFALSPPSDVADIVVQDEYTHDVVLPWKNGRFLVFDTT